MRYCLAVVLFLLLTGCNQNNSQYYWQNPLKMKQALSACPDKQPKGISCEQLTKIAAKFGSLASELKRNPQLFGLHIIAIQQNIAHMEKSLKDKHDPQLSKKIAEEKATLTEYLAVVSLYESPKGVKDENSGQ